MAEDIQILLCSVLQVCKPFQIEFPFCYACERSINKLFLHAGECWFAYYLIHTRLTCETAVRQVDSCDYNLTLHYGTRGLTIPLGVGVYRV